MRKLAVSLAVTLTVVLASSLAVAGKVQPAEAKDPKEPTARGTLSKAELQRLYTDYLTQQGYKPEVDSDGDVRFKREGRSYFILVAEGDLAFFRVALPNIWPIESEKERALVLAALDEANGKTKVAKAFTVRDNVWASVEVFLTNPQDFKNIFERSLSALDTSVAIFVKKMKENQ